MRYSNEAIVARRLLSSGIMTITEVSHAAGVARALAVVWARPLGPHLDKVRRDYLDRAWHGLSMSGESEGKSNRDLVVAIVAAGYALPAELALFALCGDQTARLWCRAAGIKAKMIRRAWCAKTWSTALAERQEALARYRAARDAYHEAARQGGIAGQRPADFMVAPKPEDFGL